MISHTIFDPMYTYSFDVIVKNVYCREEEKKNNKINYHNVRNYVYVYLTNFTLA